MVYGRARPIERNVVPPSGISPARACRCVQTRSLQGDMKKGLADASIDAYTSAEKRYYIYTLS